MGSKPRVVGYVDESTERTAKAKADAADMSLSEWVGEAVAEKIEREGMESRGEQYRIEERILDLVDESAERAAEQIVDEIRDELPEVRKATWGKDG